MVDPWIDGLWLALKKVFLLQKEKEGMSNDVSAVSSTLSAAARVGHELNLSSEIQNLKLEDKGDASSDVSSQKPVDINLLASARDTDPSLVHSVPPISQAALNIPVLPPEYIEVQFQDTPGEVRNFEVRMMKVSCLLRIMSSKEQMDTYLKEIHP